MFLPSSTTLPSPTLNFYLPLKLCPQLIPPPSFLLLSLSLFVRESIYSYSELKKKSPSNSLQGLT